MSKKTETHNPGIDSDHAMIVGNPNKSVAVETHHDYDYDPELDGHGGDDDSKDFRPPFVKLLQALSPEVSAQDSNYKQGDFLLSGQQRSIKGKDGFVFLPCYHEKRYVEWRAKENGGGIANRYTPTDPAIQSYIGANGKITLPNGNTLVETVYLYGILDDQDELPACVVTFKSSQMKVWSQMTTRRRQIFHGRVDSKHPQHVKANSPEQRVIPGFAVKWKFKAVQETKKDDATQRYYNYEVSLDGETKDKSCLISPNSVAFLKAKDLRAALNTMRNSGVQITETAGVNEDHATESTYE
jgi:hypothetical protein